MSEEMVANIVSWGIKILGALIGIWVSVKLADLVKRLTIRGLKARKFDATLTSFFGTMVRWALLACAGLAILGIFGIETTSFAALIAATGLAVGLALQGTLSNFAAGVMLLVFRPFNIDDVVKVGGEIGKIAEIGLFVTTIDTPDNRRVILPNSGIFGTTIENVTFHDSRRVDVTVGVDYSADMKKTREVLERVAAGITGRLDEPGHQIMMTNLGESSVDWEVRVWCATADYFAVLEEILESTKAALDEAAIGIPYPTMDLNLLKNAA